jgi:hypothetical protein
VDLVACDLLLFFIAMYLPEMLPLFSLSTPSTLLTCSHFFISKLSMHTACRAINYTILVEYPS